MPIMPLTSHPLKVLSATFLLLLILAENVLALPLQKQLLEIATRHNLPPYVENDAAGGIEIDLVRAILHDSIYEPVFVQQPRVRMIAAFENGEMGGIITQNINASSAGCATDWYIAHQNIAITLAQRKLEIDNLGDLGTLSVLSFSGATRYLGAEFQKAVQKTRRYTESGDQSKHIALLYKGRFDVVVGDRWILALAQKRYLAASGEYKPLTSHPIMKPSLYVARFHEQEVCDAFNLGLRRLRASGEYAEIWSGYENSLAIVANESSPLPQ